MYSLLFHNKWLAAMWAGSVLLGIYLTTPSESESVPIAAIAAGPGGGIFATDPAASKRRKEEAFRKNALDEFNSSADEQVTGPADWE